jgi:hypothetical protein
MEPTGPRERGPMTGSTKSGPPLDAARPPRIALRFMRPTTSYIYDVKQPYSEQEDVSQIYCEVHYNIHFVAVSTLKQDPGSG